MRELLIFAAAAFLACSCIAALAARRTRRPAVLLADQGNPPQGNPPRGNPWQGNPAQGQPPTYGQYPQGQYPQGQYPPGQYPGPQRPKWAVPAAVVAVAAVLLCVLLIGVLLSRSSGGGEPPQPAPTAAPAAAPTEEPAPTTEPTAVPTEEPAPTQEPTPAPTQEPAASFTAAACLDEALDWIEDFPTYVKDYDFEPLGCVDDFDGDGVQDFLAMFQTEAANGTRGVSYVLFTFAEDGPQLLDDGVLYQEVGGNGGSVGVARRDGAAYFVKLVKTADGDTVSSQYLYTPWEAIVQREAGASFYLESTWSTGDGRTSYIVGAGRADKEDFDRFQANFTELYTLDIVAGHGNGLVNGMDFDSLEKWYGQ